jgi:putative sigma-54 modulation protein
MKVNVHAVNFSVDGKLGFIQERMDKLEKYYDKVVFRCLKVEKTVIKRIRCGN